MSTPNRNSGSLLIRLAAGLAVTGLAVVAGFTFVARPWYLRWGATDAELQMPLPGDEYIPSPVGAMPTRAITIQATPAEIWPWLAQLGAGKGGFYSYTQVEGLLNCPIVNADRIHAEWQNIQPGDPVKMCPGDFGPPPYIVIAVLPERALIIGHAPASEAEIVAGAEWFDTWAFVLEPVDENSTRLIVRYRNSIEASWTRIVEPGFFIMERGMLLGIKDRAERQTNA